jgi:hypothetical protein
MSKNFILTFYNAMCYGTPCMLHDFSVTPRRYRGSLMIIIMMIMAIIVCLVIIVIKQYIEYSKDITTQTIAVNQPVPYNTGSYNKALVTIGQITMVLVCLVLAFIPALLVNNFCLQLDPSLLMIKDIPGQLVSGLVLPCLFYFWNPEARRHVKMTFWDLAPEWLHQCSSSINPTA